MNRPVGKAETTIGAPLGELDTPALLVDAAALEANIAAMARLCAGKPARLRPHAKTHKSPTVARQESAARSLARRKQSPGTAASATSW
jgi:3-hydroxy-D-aspartate aldolase